MNSGPGFVQNPTYIRRYEERRIALVGPQSQPGLDWDKKSALAYFGPGGPPPLLSLSLSLYIYIYMIYTTSQKILNSKIFNVF